MITKDIMVVKSTAASDPSWVDSKSDFSSHCNVESEGREAVGGGAS